MKEQEVKHMRDFGEISQLIIESSERIATCPGHEMMVTADVEGCQMRMCRKCGLPKMHVSADLFKRIPPPYRRSDVDRYLAMHNAFAFSPHVVRAIEDWSSSA